MCVFARLRTYACVFFLYGIVCVRPFFSLVCIINILYFICWKLMLALTWIPWGFEYTSILKWRKNVFILLHIDHNTDHRIYPIVWQFKVNQIINLVYFFDNWIYRHFLKFSVCITNAHIQISPKIKYCSVFFSEWALPLSYSLSNRSIVVFQAFPFFLNKHTNKKEKKKKRKKLDHFISCWVKNRLRFSWISTTT